MNEHSGDRTSIWMATEKVASFPTLTDNMNVDVCIVGAGIAGISTAYMLMREGKSVAVLDDGPMASGETERTTAHLTNAYDDRYYEMERMHGDRGAQLIADSHSTAISRIEANVHEEGIDCDFQRLDGFLFVPPGESTRVLEEELAACHRAGLMDVEWVDHAPLDFDTGPCLRFPRQGQFHPLKYMNGLARAIVAGGGKIFANTHVDCIEGGSPGKVRTSNGKEVIAKSVVVATNSPVNDLVAIHTKQAPYRTYVIGMRVAPGAIRRALYWDTLDPYHYVRLQAGDDHDVLIVGGEDHKTGQPPEVGAPFMNLEDWARQRFPVGEVEFRWSGQVLEPNDGIAFIGRNPMDKDNVYVCTGDSGQGMTHGTIASILLTDLILGRPNEWADLYDPGRVKFKAAGEFARENLNVAKKYGDWLVPGEVESIAQIAPGNGGIIRRGLTKIAVYRDEAGTIHERSAVCRHLGCVVQWNSVEKSWDCPCHGSRYDRFGTVVNGPAMHDLKIVESKAVQHSHAGVSDPACRDKQKD